jgi:hypothetical protein
MRLSLPLTAVACATAVTAIAVSSATGTPTVGSSITKVKALSDGGQTSDGVQTASATFTPVRFVGGGRFALTMAVPAGHTAFLLADFSGSATCFPETAQCLLRVLVDGTPANPPSIPLAPGQPDPGNRGAEGVDSSYVAQFSSPTLGAGLHQVVVQWRVAGGGAAFADFFLQSAHLVVEEVQVS